MIFKNISKKLLNLIKNNKVSTILILFWFFYIFNVYSRVNFLIYDNSYYFTKENIDVKIDDRTEDVEETILEINNSWYDKKTIKFWYYPWMRWCTKSSLTLTKNSITTELMPNGDKLKDAMICAVWVNYIKKDILEVPVCYAWGWGSWDCIYSLMNYNLKTQKWSYKWQWAVSYYLYDKSYISKSQIDKLYFMDILSDWYMTYILYRHYEETFKEFINYFQDNNLLENQSNIPFIYRKYLDF